MSKRSRARQREAGVRKEPNETKAAAEGRGVRPAINDARPWREPLRSSIGRRRVELRHAGQAVPDPRAARRRAR